jgi:hypothetical protein
MLHDTRAGDPTMLHTTNKIASEHANPTQHALDQVTRLLHYSVAFPDNSIVFHKSRMHLIQQVDASSKSIDLRFHWLRD